nr:hypothetical protein [Streptomyces sp. 846.5]
MRRGLGHAAVLTISTGWLAPDGASNLTCSRSVLLPVGVRRDCLRTSAGLGMPVLERLLAEPADADQLGPVLWDHEQGVLYWLIQPGACDHYPAGVELLRAGTWIVAPDAGDIAVDRGCWLHLPDQHILSGPAWLAAALRSQHAEPAAPPDPPSPGRIPS